MEQELNRTDSQSETSQEEAGSEIRRKSDIAFELVLIFILGFLLGVTIKTEAAKRVTIGFNDYKIEQVKQSYDFAAIKEGLKKAQEKAQQAAPAENDAAQETQKEAPKEGAEEQKGE